MVLLAWLMGGGVHAVLAAISRFHSFSAGPNSLLTSGGFLMRKQETPNAAPVAPNNRPPLITCGEQTPAGQVFGLEFHEEAAF